jgi:hypothetical protein
VDAVPKDISEFMNKRASSLPNRSAQRNLGFEELHETCQNVKTSIKKGPTEVLKNITHSSQYDFRKRPNTAPVNRGEYAGREATTAPDNVTYSLLLSSVEKVSVYNEEIILSVYELLFWHDPRLSFDLNNEAACVVGAGSSMYPAITLNGLETEGEFQTIWTPDIYMVNSRAKTVIGETVAYIFEDGYVVHFQQKTITTACPMYFGSYPYTTIECKLDISTFSQSYDEITLVYQDDSIPLGISSTNHIIDLKTHLHNDKIGSFILDVNNVQSKSYIDEPTSKQHLIGTITLIHEPGSLWEAVLIPDCLLHLAIFSSFWISSSAAPARVTICVIAALTFRVLMSSLYAQLPPVSYSLWY